MHGHFVSQDRWGERQTDRQTETETHRERARDEQTETNRNAHGQTKIWYYSQMYKLHGWCSLRVYFLRNNDESGWKICVSKTTRMALTLVWLPWREDLHQDGKVTGVSTTMDGIAIGVVTLKGTICIRMAKLLVWAQPPGWHCHNN